MRAPVIYTSRPAQRLQTGLGHPTTPGGSISSGIRLPLPLQSRKRGVRSVQSVGVELSIYLHALRSKAIGLNTLKYLIYSKTLSVFYTSYPTPVHFYHSTQAAATWLDHNDTRWLLNFNIRQKTFFSFVFWRAEFFTNYGKTIISIVLWNL